MKGCWVGVDSEDEGAASQGPLLGGEDSGPDMLWVDGLPGLVLGSDTPGTRVLAVPRCRRRLTSSFSSTTVTSRPGSFRSYTLS